MIDFARITVVGGKGGDGAGSFTHIKGKRRGKADGGDGGRGGHVYLEATGDLNTLEPFRYVKEYKASNGESGASRRRKGAEGGDLIIKVPRGTLIRLSGYQDIGALGHQGVRYSGKQRSDSQVTRQLDDQIMFDLVNNNQRVLIANGGEGGKGNSHLRDEYGRRPYGGQRGELGEEVQITLELKSIADVGLIGLPNAGKSTLLAALTQARPKVADYPFTTLEPNLGVIRLSGCQGIRLSGKDTQIPGYLNTRHPRQLILADIPGLIEGASKGKGLGDLFLRHIERTKILVHLVDISKVVEVGNIWKDYQSIRIELREYSKALVKKKEIIVLNKIDLVSNNTATDVLSFFKKKHKKTVAISAVTKDGLDELIKNLEKLSG